MAIIIDHFQYENSQGQQITLEQGQDTIQASDVIISPASPITTQTSIHISCPSVPDAEIFYTTNGDMPIRGGGAIVVPKANTKLLMHFNGDFTDEIGNAFTTSGGATVDSTETKFGNGAGKFLRTSVRPCIGTPAVNHNFDLIGDFTIAGWFKWASSSPGFPGQQLIGCHRSGVNCDWILYWDAGGPAFHRITFVLSGGDYALRTTDLFVADVNQWYHIAVTRSAGTMRLFVNGVMQNSSVYRPADYICTLPLTIGNSALDSQNNDPMNGYIDEIIIRNDVEAEWATDAGFAVPTLPYSFTAIGTDTNKLITEDGFTIDEAHHVVKAKAFKTGWTTQEAPAVMDYSFASENPLSPFSYNASVVQTLAINLTVPQVATPEISFSRIGDVTTVTITCATLNANIIYGIDETPNINYDAQQKFTISSNCTIRAAATKIDMQDSQEVSAVYDEFILQASDIYMTPSPITVQDHIHISCDAHPNAEIFYTTDGTIPVRSGVVVIPQEKTKLLMHLDGDYTDASNFENIFFAGSGGTLPAIDAANKQFGNGSARFSNNTDVLRSERSHLGDSFLLDSGDFTVDGWFNWDQEPTHDQHLVGCSMGIPYPHWSTYWAIKLVFVSAGQFSLDFNALNNMTIAITYPFQIDTDRWYHIAVVRNNSQIKMYVDGMPVGNIVTDNSQIQIGVDFTIGNDLNNSTPFHGYVDEVRISNNAMWTDAFDRPAFPYSFVDEIGTGSSKKFTNDFIVDVDSPTITAKAFIDGWTWQGEPKSITYSFSQPNPLSPYAYNASVVQSLDITVVQTNPLSPYVYNASSVQSLEIASELLAVEQPQISFNRVGNTTTVTITCATLGVDIYYRVNDGAEIHYSNPFAIAINSSIRAVGKMAGMNDSTEATNSYSGFIVYAADVVITPAAFPVTTQTTISISCSVPGVQILYTTDGTTPEDHVTVTTHAFTGDFTLDVGSITVNAKAFRSGWTTQPSPASITYSVSQPRVAQPVITVVRNGNIATVSIVCATADAVIYYGIDSSPTLPYNPPWFTIEGNSTIRAFGRKLGMNDSAEATSSYSGFVLQASDVFIDPMSESITTQSLINFSCNVPPVQIFYTIDSLTPIDNVESDTNILFVDAFYLGSGNHVVRFKAFKDGWTTQPAPGLMAYSVSQTNPLSPFVYNASIVQSLVVFNVAPRVASPIFQPDGATITEPQLVSIIKESGSRVYWTDNNAETLSDASREYLSPILVSSSVTLRAFATKPGEQDSLVAQAQFYFLSGNVEAPTTDQPSGTYDGAISISLVSATNGATIYYTTDGTVPDQTKLRYDPLFGISITADVTIKAMAWKHGMIPSPVVTFSYHIVTVTKVAKPQITPNGGSFILYTDVTINTITAGATIYYSSDGSNPSSSSPTSTQYVGQIRISHGQTLKAIAVKSDLEDSNVAGAVFNIQQYLTPGVIEVTNDTSSLIGGAAIVRWQVGDPTGITGFKIKYGTESGVYGYTYNITNPGLRTATISGLLNGRRYYFVVVSIYGSDESLPSNELNCVVRDTHAPLPPSNFSATITGDGLGILLRWKNPTTDFDHVVLVKNTNHPPVSTSDGNQIYIGADEEFIDRDI